MGFDNGVDRKETVLAITCVCGYGKEEGEMELSVSLNTRWRAGEGDLERESGAVCGDVPSEKNAAL